jgi:hypothetical protein
LVSSINLSSLSSGLQVFRFRCRDNTGSWSSTISQFFFKNAVPANFENKVIAYRYWFDEKDSLETSLTISLQSEDSIELITELDVSSIVSGWHIIHFQFQDSIGQWSSATSDSVEIRKNININVYLESLFAGNHVMKQAKGVAGAQYGENIADQTTVELRNASSPYAAVYENTTANLKTDGTLVAGAIPDSLTNPYYIVIKHRNSIETWSALPVDFSGAGPFSYDFTTAASQAYGDNLLLMGSDWVIFGGDATQDGIVDGSDMSFIENASTAILHGYYPEDVNGDGIVDGGDMSLIENNSTAIVRVLKP